MANPPTFRQWILRKLYHIEVTFAVSMFTPWERFVFWTILFLLSGLTFIAAILYLPHHVAILAGRAWYYINGEHIDVASSARDAVRDMTAGVFQEAKATATTGGFMNAVTAGLGKATSDIGREL